MKNYLKKIARKIINKCIPKSIKKQYINYGIKQAKKNAFSGNNVYCPCCQNTFITFLPTGLKKRANAVCPVCYTVERHRLLWLYLEKKTNLFRDKIKLLHVAPEPLFFKKFSASPNIEYVPCVKMGEGYRDTYPEGTLNVDITSIQFPDDTFDAIICSHVLEHVPEDIKAMKEFYRVLKPGGWAILQVPLDSTMQTTYEDFSINTPEGREKAFGQYDHVRIYGNDYTERLSSTGFHVNRDNFQQEFSEEEIFRYGFIKNEDIFYCEKVKQ